MKARGAAAGSCRCNAFALASLIKDAPRYRLRPSFSFLWFLLVTLPCFQATTPAAASCLPALIPQRMALCGSRCASMASHSRGSPVACIGFPVASMQDLWRRLWRREPAAAVARAAAATAGSEEKATAKTKKETEAKRGYADLLYEDWQSDAPQSRQQATHFSNREGEEESTASSSYASSESSASPDSTTAEPLLSEGSMGSAAAAAEEVRAAARWFEHQRGMWRSKTAAKIQVQLEALVKAQETAREEQNRRQKPNRPRRLVFSPPSLKERGWLAARSCKAGKNPLSCILYAATPPGRLAVAPASSISAATDKSDIPWVSFSGLARLNRTEPLRAKALWFGHQAPEFASFYESAPPHVLLLRFLLDQKHAIPCLLAAACCGSAFVARAKLSRLFVSFILSSTVWSRYSLWSPLVHAPPALALLLLRLMLQGAVAAGGAATAACRRSLEELEAALLESAIESNFPNEGLDEILATASHPTSNK
ncbi:uncharacterized protein LOC34619039 [Cyclospora cayetanensis]|uniref:Uncharacterized protein LOC34619039 n=1 Tax=Cyclospora cayetanensis TaxID=88456 RepID=A0A6P6S327_9EIME|nr:uncharacterized protein LOC34619039 [Cyclospora cayetanensis]